MATTPHTAAAQSIPLADPAYVGDLGDGLIRRWSTRADLAKIGHLFASVFRDGPDEPLNIPAGDEARVFMSNGFPLMGPGDFAVVEDTSKPDRPIVASTSVWRRRWSYGSIEFGVGQPENVATDPAYRNRGLVRALFAMFHARSAAEGHLAQAITGIRYFYRQFGYEYVLDLGGRTYLKLTEISASHESDPAPYHLRLATLADIPHLQALYNQRRAASLVWQETTDAYWRYHITAWNDVAVRAREITSIGMLGRLYMIVDQADQICGYIWLASKRWGSDLPIYALELYPNVQWQALLPVLLPTLRQQAQQTPVAPTNAEPCSELCFHLGRAHPVYELLNTTMTTRYASPYAWYLRVPDVPAFVRHIAPVLDARLAASASAGYTGELIFDFYRGGLRLVFAEGKLNVVEPWQAPLYGEQAHASCPALLFLQLLFGYRSLADLRATFPDVWAQDEVTLLINTLFPTQPSTVYSLTYT
ncbi:MAG: GNAT family N-acetyltransferase [Caldilineaceae bacterium]